MRIASRAGVDAPTVVAVVVMVEVHQQQVVWRKSTRSMGGNNECVHVGFGRSLVAVRDSKDPDGPKLTVGRDEWMAFVRFIAALPV